MHAPERVKLRELGSRNGDRFAGNFLVCRDAGARMAARRRGAIVNVASIAGMTSAPTHAYAAAKAGVIQLTDPRRRMGTTRRARQRGVARFHPHAGARSGPRRRRALERDALTRPSAMGRLVEPDEVAQAIVWLIGPEKQRRHRRQSAGRRRISGRRHMGGVRRLSLKSKGDPSALPGWRRQFDVSGGAPARFRLEQPLTRKKPDQWTSARRRFGSAQTGQEHEPDPA